MSFDFSGYRIAPKGWKILRADNELWLDHPASGRVYYITSICRSEFEIWYTSIMTPTRQFVSRTDAMFRALQMIGLIMPQPSMPKQLNLAAQKERDRLRPRS